MANRVPYPNLQPPIRVMTPPTMIDTRKIKHGKLDKRFTGGNAFKYFASFENLILEYELFCNIRNWCWDTWGSSREVWYMMPVHNFKWAWLSDNYRYRIYFKTEQEYEWFILRWAN